MLRLPAVLLTDGLVGDGIEQAGADDAERRLKAHGVVRRDGLGVEGRLRDGDFGIDQLVPFAVGELHRQAALHRRDRLPLDVDLVRIDGRQEGVHGLRLRAAGNLGDVWSIVAVRPADGVIDGQQVAIAVARCVVRLAPAVAVSGVTVEAGFADGDGPEPEEGLRVDGVIALEEGFAEVELVREPHLIHCRRLVLVASGRDVVRRAQAAAGIPFIGCEVAHGFPHIIQVWLRRWFRFRIVGARRHRKEQQPRSGVSRE